MSKEEGRPVQRPKIPEIIAKKLDDMYNEQIKLEERQEKAVKAADPNIPARKKLDTGYTGFFQKNRYKALGDARREAERRGKNLMDRHKFYARMQNMQTKNEENIKKLEDIPITLEEPCFL